MGFLISTGQKTRIPSGHPKLSPDAAILELGAGTGLVGLTAAATFQARVVLTDLPEIVPNLERNVEANASVVEARGGNVTVSVLDWNNPEQCRQASSPYSYPLMLAADPSTLLTIPAFWSRRLSIISQSLRARGW